MSLEKITIVPLEGSLPSVSAQYNPKELSFSKSVQYQDEDGAGRDYPTVQFTQGQAISISVELFFDHYESGGDVRGDASTVLAMCMIDDSLNRPPMVELVWGGANPAFNGAKFYGVIESANVKYTMFDGAKPVRASISVTIKQADQTQSKVAATGNVTTTTFMANMTVADVSNNDALKAAIIAGGGDPADPSTWADKYDTSSTSSSDGEE